MAGSKQVIGVLLAGLSLWAGLCLLGPQTPLAGERQAAETGNRKAKVSSPAGAVELRCLVEQPIAVLSAVAPGESVKKGDLLVELDTSALVDKRMQQVFLVHKVQAELTRAVQTRQSAVQVGQGQIDLAQRALRLAQGQLQAYQDGEYPNQLALAEGTAAIAEQRCRMLDDRWMRLRAAADDRKDEAALNLAQEADLALREAQLRSNQARNTLEMIKRIGHNNKIAELELAVAQEEFELARAKAAIADANMQANTALSLAKMSLKMEADRLTRLDDQIAKCKVYAPQDGAVDQPRDNDEVAVKPGAVVRERQILVRLVPVKASKP